MGGDDAGVMGRNRKEQLFGGGEAGVLLRALDWRFSPLGEPDGWPDALKSVVQAVLGSDAPMMVQWGPEQILFYNDAFAPRLGDRHPSALGQPSAPGWADINEAQGRLDRVVDGKATPPTGATIDVTERRLVDMARSESDERYRALFESIELGFCIIEVEFDAAGEASDYLFLEVNPAFERQTGVRDAVGRRALDVAPGHGRVWLDAYGAVARTGESIRFEAQAGPADDRWFHVHAQKAGGVDSRTVALIFSDITEAKTAEMKLRVSEGQFRTFAEAMPNHVWTSPPDGSLDWFNARVYEYAGALPGELHGTGWGRMVHPDDILGASERWAAAVATGNIYETEFRLLRADGAYRWHIARAVPIRTESGEITRWIGTNTEIEDQKAAAQALADLNVTLESHVEARTQELMETEAQLRQSQKMEAIGQLTGGIAHDFNNLMQGIIAALSLVRRRMDKAPREEIERFMDAAAASAQRAASLTHRLLAFSRRQSLDVRASDLGGVVEGMRELLNQTLGENIALEIQASDGLWRAMTDENQFENALLNLAINARDAMTEGGELKITLINRRVQAGRRRTERDVAPGDYVSVSVSDTGEGMSPEVLAKAFDPFFTTKPIGQGTGLGLSMIYGFAKQSGGHVDIESAINRGTRVELLLPRAEDEGQTRASSRLVSRTPRGEGRTVLVVEDDPTVRMMVMAALVEWGYRPIEAANAPEAIPVLCSEDAIDLLLTDVGLPSINGRQLADIARKYRPDLKVLFMTGYAEKAALRGGFLDAGMDLLTKPFELDALGSKIGAMLDG
ncbi:MAG: PAS domain-containing protein [Alphaproteobacteria bacterium]|nr:PAS domain-containing protein [Alphaproteobacteria bacterium]